jgi:hypothetical protein
MYYICIELRYLSWYSDSLWVGQPGSSSQHGKIFLFSTVSRLALGPTQPPIQWVLGAISLGVKWPEHEADHSTPTSSKVKNGEAIHPLPHMPSQHSAWLIKHRDNFIIFTLIILVLFSVKHAGHWSSDKQLYIYWTVNQERLGIINIRLRTQCCHTCILRNFSLKSN